MIQKVCNMHTMRAVGLNAAGRMSLPFRALNHGRNVLVIGCGGA
jgi:hypothetical protein